MILLFLELGLSLVWLMCDDPTKASLAEWIVASPNQVWGEGKVWTLVTSPFLELRFISLLFQAFVIWTFVPMLERFWGTRRFLRYAAMVILAGTVVGTLAGLATGREVPIAGMDTLIFSSIVAYGVIYARQPVRFFGVLPLTGRQLMYGILGFLALFIILQQSWEEGAGFAAAIGLTALIVSQRFSPELAWQRWRRRRARRHLEVLEGGKKKKAEPPRYIN